LFYKPLSELFVYRSALLNTSGGETTAVKKESRKVKKRRKSAGENHRSVAVTTRRAVKADKKVKTKQREREGRKLP